MAFDSATFDSRGGRIDGHFVGYVRGFIQVMRKQGANRLRADDMIICSRVVHGASLAETEEAPWTAGPALWQQAKRA